MVMAKAALKVQEVSRTRLELHATWELAEEESDAELIIFLGLLNDLAKPSE